MPQDASNTRLHDADLRANIAKRQLFRRYYVIIIVIILLMAVSGTAAWRFLRPTPSTDSSVEVAELHTLQTSLSMAQANLDDQAVSSVTTQLITGASSHTFTINSGQLAQYYLDRASSSLNLTRYRQAISDSETAAQLDSSLKLAALQVTFEASYKNGQRQQLIPMLQQLIQLEQHSGDPMSGGLVSRYQQDMQAIQRGQELSF